MRLGTGIKLLSTTLGLMRSQWWSNEKIAAYQRTRLVEMLRYCVEHVPYYADLGLSPAHIATVDDLQRFPITRKRDVQAQAERFLARPFANRALNVSTSSGMTGEPTATYFDQDSWIFVKFALKARRVLSDVKWPKQRVMILSASHARAWSSIPSLGLVDVAYMSVSDPEAVDKNLDALLDFEPTILYGLPSYLVALADAAKQRKAALPRVPLIYTSSEVLSSSTRATLGRAYRGRIVDIYGSSEFKEIAVQCKHGRYHINFESVYLETVAETQAGPKRLIVTGLVNKAMPLVRYDLGDTAEIVAEPCPCGRKSTQLVEVQGRLADVIEFPDGTRVAPYVLEDVIERQPTVRFFAIVHESPWSLRIELLEDGAQSDSARHTIERGLRERLPPQATLRFVRLTSRHSTMKRRAVSREF